MFGKATVEEVEALLAELPGLGKMELQIRFRRLYGSPPPLRISRYLLEIAVAYRIQEQAFGGLKPAIRRALLSGQTVPGAMASPGSVVIREWRGQHYAATLFPDRVEYQGKTYRSLTEVAGLITGQKRSGPAFFGLKARHG